MIRSSRLIAERRKAGSKYVHKLIRVFEDNGEREVLDTRTSAHSYSYAVIRRGWGGGRTYSWSRNKGTGTNVSIAVKGV